MAQRFLCLQGHQWLHKDMAEESLHTLFCPTCGLRLYAESRLDVDRPRLPTVDGNPPTPMDLTASFRQSWLSTDGHHHPAPAIQPSDIEEIPGYELLGILGRGGMGIVYRARQLSLKRQVALKMILTGRHVRPEDRARFQREAEAVARLQHANIVQIYEVGQQNELPYFSLEFANAGSLAQFLGGNPQVPLASAQLVLALARAMHYAHKRGIVHRDLKPANILLHLDESTILKNGHSPDPTVFRELSSYVAKISDFGLAKHVGGEEGPFRQGAILGTPSYMAPEQARGSASEIGPATDVYALGTILYEMLTGRPPFKAATLEETAHQVLTQQPVPPTELQPTTPRDLETICLTCLKKSADERYNSAEALAEDLRRFLANEPILARPSSVPERLVKWAARHPMPTLVLGGATVLTLLLAWSGARAVFDLRDEAARAHAARKGADDQVHRTLQGVDQLVVLTDRAIPDDAAGRTQRRREILTAAAQVYERVIRDEPPNQQPLLVALAQLKLGDLHGRLGDAAAARRANAEAVRLLSTLCESAPNRDEYRQLLREGEKRLGERPTLAGW